MIQNIDKFEKSQKIKFKNNYLLIEALTHKSANKNLRIFSVIIIGDFMGFAFFKVFAAKRRLFNDFLIGVFLVPLFIGTCSYILSFDFWHHFDLKMTPESQNTNDFEGFRV